MPRAARAQRFLANPHAWMDDPAVQAMGLEARGAYATLWLAGWDQKEPGVYLSDPRVLAQLARCTPEEWSRVTEEVSRAFDTVTVCDRWVLHAFSVTLASQSKKRDADRKRQAEYRMRRRDVTHVTKSESHGGSGSGSGSGSGTHKPPPLPRPRDAGPLSEIPLPVCIPREAWRSFVEHRSSLGAKGKLTANAARLAIAELVKLDAAGSPSADVIARSVLNNWRGLFALEKTGAKMPASTPQSIPDDNSDGWSPPDIRR